MPNSSFDIDCMNLSGSIVLCFKKIRRDKGWSGDFVTNPREVRHNKNIYTTSKE